MPLTPSAKKYGLRPLRNVIGTIVTMKFSVSVTQDAPLNVAKRLVVEVVSQGETCTTPRW